MLVVCMRLQTARARRRNCRSLTTGGSRVVAANSKRASYKNASALYAIFERLARRRTIFDSIEEQNSRLR